MNANFEDLINTRNIEEVTRLSCAIFNVATSDLSEESLDGFLLLVNEEEEHSDDKLQSLINHTRAMYEVAMYGLSEDDEEEFISEVLNNLD